MSLPEFTLETYFAKYEFNAKYLLCCSDAETYSMKDILALASPEDRECFDNLPLCYTESTGLPTLKDEIVNQFYSDSLIQADNILCLAGAEEGVSNCTFLYSIRWRDFFDYIYFSNN